ncbi:MAG: hypothetical protein K9M36_01240 [Candidatus Pacebacteria bacterium]|nr:hypothetical protein [Candidatus Paceibacterota bacterium]
MSPEAYQFLKTRTAETNPPEIEGVFSFQELSQKLADAKDFQTAREIYQTSITCAQNESITEIDRDELQVWALGKMTEFAKSEEEKSIIEDYYKANNS